MIYLLRHGKPDSAEGRFIGQTDLPLSAEGIEQANQWARFFSKNGITFDAVFASDLLRCKKTSEIAAPGAVEYLPSLREINLGEWDGKPYKEIIESRPAEWKERGGDIASFRPALGESFYDLQSRVVPAVSEIMRGAGNKLVVTHAGVIRCVICHMMEVPLAKLFTLESDYAGLTLIDDSKTPATINCMNMRICP
jgi:probable phosphoglycerate mutase